MGYLDVLSNREICKYINELLNKKTDKMTIATIISRLCIS